MNKKEWYKNRILWRASQHKLIADFGKNVLSENDELEFFIENTLNPKGEILLSFIKDKDCWTILTNEEIASYFQNEIHRLPLDEVKGIIDLYRQDLPLEYLKTKAEFLLLGESKVKIWMPPGSPYFSVMNILRIFPLRTPLENDTKLN